MIIIIIIIILEPSIPTDLKEELVDGNSVILTWKPPVTPNGLINSYQIIYSGRERTLVCSLITFFTKLHAQAFCL